MKTTVFELPLPRWPYGLEVLPSKDGLLLRPRRKARDQWRKAFRCPVRVGDDLDATRRLANEFDQKEWEW